jgi:hypothetical protein
MIMHYASQADINAMAGKETAAGPAWTPEEVRAIGDPDVLTWGGLWSAREP